MTFERRIVWITGASSGIGQSLATALLHRGASVIVSGRREEALARVAATAPERALVLPFEATAFDTLAGVVERAWGWRGGIDLLVNNAGISQRSLALDTGLDVYRQLLEVDVLGPVALTQQVLPRMVARSADTSRSSARSLARSARRCALATPQPSTPWSATSTRCVAKWRRPTASG
jgi:NADP-dependent 3-hydroxy acid dehydrogenase YdfG